MTLWQTLTFMCDECGEPGWLYVSSDNQTMVEGCRC